MVYQLCGADVDQRTSSDRSGFCCSLVAFVSPRPGIAFAMGIEGRGRRLVINRRLHDLPCFENLPAAVGGKVRRFQSGPAGFSTALWLSRTCRTALTIVRSYSPAE